MKRLVKVYIDVPSNFYDPPLIEKYFREALERRAQQPPTDARLQLIKSSMIIERIQVGPKLSVEEE